jgi:hypothetical protein
MDLVAESRNANATVIQKDDDSKNKIIDSIAASEDKNVAIKVLQSNNRLNLIEHRSIDSTELNSIILKLAESSGKTVRILSPNRMMSNDINENIKRKPSNLWQWLVSLGKPEVGECVAGFKHKYQEEIDLPLLRLRQGKDVIVVNNAETLGCGDTKVLLELTQKTNAKLIFLRDLNARSSFAAGNPMQTLKQAGIETFKINTERDKANKCTVELTTIKDNDERIKQLARTYALKDDKERNNTTVFLGSKEQLKSASVAIREELKSLGKLSGIEHNIQVLTPIYLSEPESTIAHRYQQNMVIRFYDVNYKHRDWNIESIDKEKNTLRLAQGSRRLLLNPKKYNQDQKTRYVIFKKEYLQLAKGDRLIATANMSELGIKSTTKFTVQEIDEKRVELLSNSKVIRISLSDLKKSHLQYDYATTLSKHSKKKADHVLADIKSYSLDKPTIRELTNRARESIIVFTDNDISQKRFGSTPVKLTATETLLGAANDKVERFINDKTITEIKSDIEKAISVISNQNALAKKSRDKSCKLRPRKNYFT